ncbi:hypothetical protein [Bradyrhizobium arachidis]|uniref:hypothetical protein n=1 Tax=Bradyrhizobium arachidis TaxID=858423 RepID=UPI002163D193|nr:hypothetical protein [Bradyrhizobium arachidis]UVO30246.1 hypothetical protein KUF59_05690 [Bradyrhizobium arachidis]
MNFDQGGACEQSLRTPGRIAFQMFLLGWKLVSRFACSAISETVYHHQAQQRTKSRPMDAWAFRIMPKHDKVVECRPRISTLLASYDCELNTEYLVDRAIAIVRLAAEGCKARKCSLGTPKHPPRPQSRNAIDVGSAKVVVRQTEAGLRFPDSRPFRHQA